MNIILFDNSARNLLYPFTLTRAVGEIRTGIYTAKERWEKLTGAKIFLVTEKYLQPLYEQPGAGEFLIIDAAVLPTIEIVESILALKNNQTLHDEYGLVAVRTNVTSAPSFHDICKINCTGTETFSVTRLSAPWHIFQHNQQMLLFDFALATKEKKSGDIDNSNALLHAHNIFLEEDATVSHSIINASTGPVYIDKHAEVMEGCTIRGPFAMGEGAVLKMGTKIYGATTIGPHCIAGGEIKNSIMMGFSNKAHEGYLGDSVIGEWCNLGAGTTVSNVKNTGTDVKVWNSNEKEFVNTGNKCGVLMGDYTRVAINTSVNTGTVMGVCSNVFGSGLTPKVIKDFSWGFEGKVYEVDKAISDIRNWKRFKNKRMSESEVAVVKYIFEQIKHHIKPS